MQKWTEAEKQQVRDLMRQGVPRRTISAITGIRVKRLEGFMGRERQRIAWDGCYGANPRGYVRPFDPPSAAQLAEREARENAPRTPTMLLLGDPPIPHELLKYQARAAACE